ncbi:MAG: metal-sensitive transcriptional regulator [Oscillospiraceae bacterium]|nr:metal-sensitive transcriptional regulator [Oscillospiraceae bacterium]
MNTVEEKKEISVRLRRIEGQVKGIEKMILLDSNFKDVLTQISAVRAALNSVGVLLFKDFFKKNLSLMDIDKDEKLEEELMNNLYVFLNKFQ